MAKSKTRGKDKRFCRQPDRHVPGLECGYPLPCPHHTLVAEPDGTVVVPPHAKPEAVRLVRAIAAVLREVEGVSVDFFADATEALTRRYGNRWISADLRGELFRRKLAEAEALFKSFKPAPKGKGKR